MDTQIFWQNLRYWAGHVPLCAAGSIGLACLGGYSSIESLCGMGAGIIFFILVYALISCWSGFQDKSRLGARALRLATRIRLVCSLLVVAGLCCPPLLMVSLDYYLGMFAIEGVRLMGDYLLDHSETVREFVQVDQRDFWFGRMESLVPTFITVVVEGVMLSLTLLLTSGFIQLILQHRREQSA